MTDIYKPVAGDDAVTGMHTSETDTYATSASSSDAGRTVLAGVLGGIVSAAGYLVYSRLPDEQKDKLHGQVRQLVETRVNELRSRFNI